MAVKLAEVYLGSGASQNSQIDDAVRNMEPVSLDFFRELIGEKELNSLNRLDEDETFDDYLSGIHNEDVKFYVGTYRGHVVASLCTYHEHSLFTPRGMEPFKLPVIGNKIEHVLKYVNKDPFAVKDSELPGSFVIHGGAMDSVRDIKNNGIDHSKTYIGHLGKALYTTMNYQYAMSYAAGDDAGVLLAQIKPTAKIVSDSSPEFMKVQDFMGREDFPEILKRNGIDGIFCRAMDAVAIHNPNAITVIECFDKEDIKKFMKNLEKDGIQITK